MYAYLEANINHRQPKHSADSAASSSQPSTHGSSFQTFSRPEYLLRGFYTAAPRCLRSHTDSQGIKLLDCVSWRSDGLAQFSTILH